MKTKLLLLHFFIPFFVFAQIQIGQDIDGEAMEDHSGGRISLNDNGNILAIAAHWNDGINGTNSGHVRVYQNTGGSWTQIGADIDGEAENDGGYGLIGLSVSLNSDGNILAVGASDNDGNGSDSGHVRIYQNIGGVWTQIGADIDGEAPQDRSGTSVSLSADGSIVAIGAPGNNGNGSLSGHVRIYQNTGGTWTQIGADIDGEAADNISGFSVSLSSDGNIVAIGAWFNEGTNGSESGHVRIYHNSGGIWTQIGADIDGEEAGDNSGYSVNLSANGNIVAIGAPRNDGINGPVSGHVRIYQNSEGSWTQIGTDIDGEADNDVSGVSVSLSADGSIVAIGAYNNVGTNGSASGQVRIYQNTGGSWIQIGIDIDGEASNDRSGRAVSLSADGSIVSIGAPDNDGINGYNSGHVRVFDLSGVIGIDDNSLSDLSVYPNPTTGILNIQSDTPISQIEVYNQLGQLVVSNANQNEIDISSVNQGIYFIKIKDENGDLGIKKVVKN